MKTVEANVVGTLNSLRLAHQIGARILQASTSEVYGDPTVHPQSETYRGNVNPIGPRACYDEGKRVAETLMMDYHRQDGVDIRIARIFNTYGPRMDEADGRVVSNFIVQTLRGEPLTLYGTGKQTRSFCYVDDLVDGLIRLMNADGVYEPVNLGNPNEFTIRALAEQVGEMCGMPSKLAILLVASGRSVAQTTGHRSCPGTIGVVAQSRAARGAPAHDRGLRRTPIYGRTAWCVEASCTVACLVERRGEATPNRP